MSLEAKDYIIYDLLSDKSFVIPENQRKYVWDKNNWEELFSDIKLVYSEKIANHFIGSVVLKEENINDGIKKHFIVIDGQQRILTITIIFCVLAFMFAKNNDIERYKGLKKQLFVTDNKNNLHTMISKDSNKDIYLIIDQLYDKDILSKICKGYTYLNFMKDITKISKNIKECFLYFYASIEELCEDDIKKIDKIRSVITDIKYINIIAKSDEDAYTIFEILNARGKPLTDYELLRNYLLKYAKIEEKQKVKNKLEEIETKLGNSTEVFLKHYVMHRYGRKTNKNETRPFKVIAKEEKNNDKMNLLEDLVKKAMYYEKFINLSICSPLENKIFSFFKNRRQQQYRPIILGLMHQRDLNKLTNDDYEKYINYLYLFFICYNVIGEEKSNKLEDIVENYSKKIENSFDMELLKKMKKSMQDRLPSENDFKSRISNIKYSTNKKAYKDNRKANNVRAIYEVVEKENGINDDLNNSEFSIEHCYPDSKAGDDENFYTIGNLMLLEKEINEKCKNKELSAKIPFYFSSKLSCPKEISNGFLIKDRTDKIANTIYKYIKKISNS